jgi:hypothetical protein
MGLYIRIYRDFLVGLYRAIIQWWWMMIWYDMIWSDMIWEYHGISWKREFYGILFSWCIGVIMGFIENTAPLGSGWEDGLDVSRVGEIWKVSLVSKFQEFQEETMDNYPLVI